MANKKEKKQGTVTLSRHYSKSGKVITEEGSQESIDILPFEQPTATVSVPIQITHNIGNYESVKTGVIVSVPCYVEEIHEGFKLAKSLAENYAEEMSSFSRAFGEFMKRWRRGDYR